MHTMIYLAAVIAIIKQATGACQDSSGQPCTYCIYQGHLDTGTYRATQPGLYCVEEDLVFNPISGSSSDPNNYGTQSWFPHDDQQYPGCANNADGAYALGFFAVISIEASNVFLDLKGHTLSQHPNFYLQQRFFVKQRDYRQQ